MNFLAHAHLSFNNPEILVGNMISDFVKGKSQFDYPEIVQHGIKLHRAIDHFTDTHKTTQVAKQYFKIPYRLYAGAFVDVAYDNFLANDTRIFLTDYYLQGFAESVYASLQNNYSILPQVFKNMLPNMISQNWLYNYKKMDGIKKSFNGIVYRAKYLTESEIGFNIFESEYNNLQKCYSEFYPQLINFAAIELQHLQNK